MICLYCNNTLTKFEFLNQFYENPLECTHCDYILVNSKLIKFDNDDPKDTEIPQNFISFKVHLDNSRYEILVDHLENSTTISKFKNNEKYVINIITKLNSAINITPSSAPDKLKTILTFL